MLHLWPGHAERLITGLYADSGVQCIIQLSPDDTTAVPVNDSCQIKESVLHRDVGDVDGSRLVRTCYIGIPKQIRDHSRTLQTLRSQEFFPFFSVIVVPHAITSFRFYLSHFDLND